MEIINLFQKKFKSYYKSLKQEQKKYKFKLSGGDTTKSNKTIFTITSLGYSKKIVQRNKCKNNDDIYVTGNLGDSYLGLLLLKKKLFLKNKSKENILFKNIICQIYLQKLVQN